MKGNNRRWRGDGLLTRWTRSHQLRFFEVICTVNNGNYTIMRSNLLVWVQFATDAWIYIYKKVSIIISNNWQPSPLFTKKHSVIIHPGPIDYNGIWLDKSPCNSLKIWKFWDSHCSEGQNRTHSDGTCSLLTIAKMQKQYCEPLTCCCLKAVLRKKCTSLQQDSTMALHLLDTGMLEHMLDFEDTFNSLWLQQD